MVKSIFASLATLGGLAIVWVTADAEYKKTWLLPCLLIVLALVGEAMIWLEYSEHRADVATEQRRGDALQAELTTTRKALEVASSEIVQLRAEAKAREPKLTYVKQMTNWQRDANTGLQCALYVFRATPPGLLRDICIKLAFTGPLTDAKHHIRGVIVQEIGSRLTILPSQRDLVYTTGVLTAGNDVIIQVFANRELDLQSSSLSPD